MGRHAAPAGVCPPGAGASMRTPPAQDIASCPRSWGGDGRERLADAPAGGTDGASARVRLHKRARPRGVLAVVRAGGAIGLEAAYFALAVSNCLCDDTHDDGE